MVEVMCKSMYGACSGVVNELIGKNTQAGPLICSGDDLLGIVGWILSELSQRNDIRIMWLDDDEEGE